MLRTIALIAAVSISLAAAAQETPHKIDMTVVLQNEAGKPATDEFDFIPTRDQPRCENCPPLTLGHAIAHALFVQFPDERDLLAEQKWARGTLAMRIKDAKDAALSAEEVAVVKRLLAKLYGPIVVMQAFPLLDPNAKPPTVK